VSPLPTGLLLQDNLQNLINEEKQMIVTDFDTSASSTCSDWESINWRTIEKQVFKLQMRIAKGLREKRHNKVKSLQWLLTHSYYPKLLAVRRVTQNNGSKTAGIDQVIWQTPKQKLQAVSQLKRRGYQAQALRRIYIPKTGSKNCDR
jgi:RNA-directed DNA polymerase